MNVKMYTTPTCSWCQREKAFLRINKIAFTEVDVSENPDAAEEMINKSGQMGVPVTDVDGTIIVGFNEPALKKALKLVKP